MKTTILSFAILFTLTGCKSLRIEHEEARNIPIANIEFSELEPGEFFGNYAGGMYKWRENSCKVTIDSGRVIRIKLLESKADYTQEFLDTLYNRVIINQSLQVDAFSGATLDSKACLKSVENALLSAKNQNQ